jgi:Glutamine synthetase
MSLWKTGDNNLFYDADDKYAQISQNARYFIGGLLEHARALSLFVCPIPNSYRRLAAANLIAGWSATKGNTMVYVPYSRKNMKETKRVVFKTFRPVSKPVFRLLSSIGCWFGWNENKIDPGDPAEEEGKREKK